MPWKGEKDPYKIWVSEIILQQTRVLQGLSYYNKFIHAFPTINHLATAPDEKVFKLWEGLGYYSRCRNLLTTARYISNSLHGRFPSEHEEILKLKGVGAYTAAAIASFAFGLPHAVIDGNVYRVLSRFFGESVPIDSTLGKKFFKELAYKLLYQPDPGTYNQAIMDFGATVCTPQNPLCDECPLQRECIAYHHNFIDVLPVKEKRLVKKSRWFGYFVFIAGGEVLVKKREAKDIWHSLNEFYLHETTKQVKWTVSAARKFLKNDLQIEGFKVHSVSPVVRQQLTHQNLSAEFIVVEIGNAAGIFNEYSRVPIADLHLLAFPKLINNFLNEAAFLSSFIEPSHA